jgi:hypothetical protein
MFPCFIKMFGTHIIPQGNTRADGGGVTQEMDCHVASLLAMTEGEEVRSRTQMLRFAQHDNDGVMAQEMDCHVASLLAMTDGGVMTQEMDCHVASLLAMTGEGVMTQRGGR